MIVGHCYHAHYTAPNLEGCDLESYALCVLSHGMEGIPTASAAGLANELVTSGGELLVTETLSVLLNASFSKAVKTPL